MGFAARAIRLVVCGILAGLAATQLDAEEPRKVAFSATDGFWVHADYYGPTSSYNPGAMVIMLHEENSDRTAWAPLIQPLRDAGFIILALDLRGHGDSATSGTRDRLEQRDPQLFRDMQHDLRGAYDWLVQQKDVDRARFAIVGAGTGAAIAMNYAAADRSVDALICLTPKLDHPGLDSVGDLGQTRGRKILLLAAKDKREACDQLAQRTDGVTKQIFPGSAHGTDMLGQAAGIEKQIVDALIRGVGRPSLDIVYGSIQSNVYHPAGSGWIDRIAPSNLRHYSSPQEAKARGLRPSRSKGPGKHSPGSQGARRPPQKP